MDNKLSGTRTIDIETYIKNIGAANIDIEKIIEKKKQWNMLWFNAIVCNKHKR